MTVDRFNLFINEDPHFQVCHGQNVHTDQLKASENGDGAKKHNRRTHIWHVLSSQATGYLWQSTCSLTLCSLGGKFSAAIARYCSSYIEMFFTEAAPFILLIWSAAVWVKELQGLIEEEEKLGLYPISTCTTGFSWKVSHWFVFESLCLCRAR